AAKGDGHIPVSIEDLDRGAIGEAVINDIDIRRNDKLTEKDAGRVIAVIHLPERVILTTRFALPGAILRRVKRACDGRFGGTSHCAVVVKGHYGWKRRAQQLAGVTTVDPLSAYLPHALDCRG